MAKDISKDPDAYNLPHIIRDAVIYYAKDGDVTVSKEQVAMLKESFPSKEIPPEVKYKEAPDKAAPIDDVK